MVVPSPAPKSPLFGAAKRRRYSSERVGGVLRGAGDGEVCCTQLRPFSQNWPVGRAVPFKGIFFMAPLRPLRNRIAVETLLGVQFARRKSITATFQEIEP